MDSKDRKLSDLEKIDFIMQQAMALHRYGASADRVEVSATQVAEKLGMKADFFSLPTGLMASFKDGLDSYNRLERLPLGKVNLDKYCRVDKAIDKVILENMPVSQGRQKVLDIISDRPLYNSLFTTTSFAFIGGAVSVFLGANSYEIILSIVLSLLVGLFSETVRLERIDTIGEAIWAFIVTVLAGYFYSLLPLINTSLVIVSSLIVLIPGLSLTTAMLELASQNVTSGTARLTAALMGIFKPAFGVYLGTKTLHYFGIIPLHHDPFEYHPLIKSFALCFSALGLSLNFQANKKDMLSILFICFISFWSLQLGKLFVGVIGASLVAGFTITIFSNLLSHKFNKPILLYLLPAIILLVPGSVGYHSLHLIMINEDINSGILEALNTAAIGISLVGGVFLGNILVRPRRTL